MSNKVLFIFEGEKTEEQIVYNLQKFFLNENTTVKCVYGAEIYQIYKEIVNDDDLDTFNLIKERNNKNKEILESYNRGDFAEIYMFFDYDGHSTLADDTKLAELLNFFKEETEKGKLYISYPMVESLKHICNYETFKDQTTECKNNIGYKGVVAKEALKDLINFTNYNLVTWKQLVNIHLRKMNYITNNSFTLPSDLKPQLFIFSKQLEKYIIPHSTVAILSSFPVFLLDYYGNEEIKKRIE
jgi:hypothetical protein